MKRNQALAVLAAAVFAAVGCVEKEAETASERKEPAGARAAPRAVPAKAAAFEGYRISGPYTHANLAVFLVHGEDRLKGKAYLTLQEALARKKLIVHETGNVQKLAIENLSADECVYVQSGDIVKGGKQDRVITYDFVVPPNSGRMSIASFCVERGRWSRRGGEAAICFMSAASQVTSKDLKLAAKHKGSQTLVWEEVSNTQDKLAGSHGLYLYDSQSPSSLQLTLENKKLQQAAEEYVKKLAPILEGREDVLGYAFAINGELNSADVYASRALFLKLWPKLLKSSAIEAIAELKKGEEFKPPAADDVNEFFAEAEKGEAKEKQVSARVRMITRKKGKNLLFETRDAAAEDVPIHKNYIVE